MRSSARIEKEVRDYGAKVRDEAHLHLLVNVGFVPAGILLLACDGCNMQESML